MLAYHKYVFVAVIAFFGSSYVATAVSWNTARRHGGAEFLLATGILAHLLAHGRGGNGLRLGSFRSALIPGDSALKQEPTLNNHGPAPFLGQHQGCSSSQSPVLNFLPNHNHGPLINNHNPGNFLSHHHGFNIRPQTPILNINPHVFNQLGYGHGQHLLQLPYGPNFGFPLNSNTVGGLLKNQVLDSSLGSNKFGDIFKNQVLGSPLDSFPLGNFKIGDSIQNINLPDQNIHLPNENVHLPDTVVLRR